MRLIRASHLHCLWSCGQIAAVNQTQIPQDKSHLLWQLLDTWRLTFSCIFDGDTEVHQQPSISQSSALQEEWSEEREGSHVAGKREEKGFAHGDAE